MLLTNETRFKLSFWRNQDENVIIRSENFETLLDIMGFFLSHKTEVSHHTEELKITVSVSTYAVKWSVLDKLQTPGFKYYVLYYEVVGVLHEISNISVQILSFPSLYQRLRVSGPGPSSWVESLTSPAGGKWWSLWLGVLGSFPRVHWFSFVLVPQNTQIGNSVDWL